MMGTKVRLFRLLKQVCLEDLVPNDHFYRHVDHNRYRGHLSSFLSWVGAARTAACARPAPPRYLAVSLPCSAKCASCCSRWRTAC